MLADLLTPDDLAAVVHESCAGVLGAIYTDECARNRWSRLPIVIVSPTHQAVVILGNIGNKGADTST